MYGIKAAPHSRTTSGTQKTETNHHRNPNKEIIQIFFEKAEFNQQLRDEIHLSLLLSINRNEGVHLFRLGDPSRSIRLPAPYRKRFAFKGKSADGHAIDARRVARTGSKALFSGQREPSGLVLTSPRKILPQLRPTTAPPPSHPDPHVQSRDPQIT